MALTAKQRRFVREFLVDRNATQAAIRAGYSAKTAREQGHALRGKPEIQTLIREAEAQLAERTEITAERVIEEMARIAFSDVGDVFTDTGGLKRVEDMPSDIRRALSSVEVVTRKVQGGDGDEVEQVAKIRLWDKQQALVNLGKHLGLFKDAGPGSLAGLIQIVISPDDAKL